MPPTRVLPPTAGSGRERSSRKRTWQKQLPVAGQVGRSRRLQPGPHRRESVAKGLANRGPLGRSWAAVVRVRSIPALPVGGRCPNSCENAQMVPSPVPSPRFSWGQRRKGACASSERAQAAGALSAKGPGPPAPASRVHTSVPRRGAGPQRWGEPTPARGAPWVV